MSNTIKIAFCPNPSANFGRMKRQMPGGGPVWKNLEVVDNLQEADLYVVFDRLPAHLEPKVKRQKVIYMRREPPHIFQDVNINQENYFATFNYPSFTSDFNPVTWWLDKTYDELKATDYSQKSKKLSAVVTNKWRKRTEFVKLAASKIKELEVWGRWIYNGSDEDFRSTSSYKGVIDGSAGATSKAIGLEPYQYSMCLENCSVDSYWTEKIADSILCWTVPIYFGASNIHKFFPPQSVIQIDMRKSSIDQIKEVISTPPNDAQIEALAEARRRILDEYNMWFVLDKLINKELV